MQNLNQYYEDCPAFRKQLIIFGRLGYNVNLIFIRIKAGQNISIRTDASNGLKGLFALSDVTDIFSSPWHPPYNCPKHHSNRGCILLCFKFNGHVMIRGFDSIQASVHHGAH